MLLRRVSQHVKTQNWFAVAIDFFIVIAGILIAFQITSWNEARKDSKRELQIIDRLQSEFTMLENETEEYIEFVESTKPIIAEFEQQIINYPEDANLELMKRFFETAFSLPRPAGQSDTYQQLIASGDMNVLDNQTLLTELVNHASLTDYFLHVNQATRQWSRTYVVPLVRLRSLLKVLPLEEAVSLSGTKADLIVAINLYKEVFEDQLNILKTHKESFAELNKMLIDEKHEKNL